jgi:hypothetical protein
MVSTYKNYASFFFSKLAIQLLKEGMMHNNDLPNVNDIFELIFHVKNTWNPWAKGKHSILQMKLLFLGTSM